ncbi:MAG TPA: hypothetical protein VF092_07440 [Longimicrobium sp.]
MTDHERIAQAVRKARVNCLVAAALVRGASRAVIRARAAVAASLVTLARVKTARD